VHHITVRRKTQRKEVKLRVSTSSRIATQTSKSQVLKGQFFPVAERADSPKNKLFGALTRLKPDLVELSYPLYQCLQVVRLLQNNPLILDQRQKNMFVWPLGCIAQVNMKPPSGGAFPAAPEGDIQALLPVIAV
jgi:hypothetical protein